jgi:peptide/nickel transport system permease protein
MRAVDVFLTIPGLPILLAVSAIFGGGHTSAAVIIGIFTFFGWPYPARLVRGQFLSLRTMEYAEAARAVGVPPVRIVFRHLLPAALRPILVATTLIVAGNIVGESALDFLNLGLQYPDTSWGSVLAFAEQEQFQNWWVTVFPGLFLALTVVAVNFIGDGISDALDVRSK